MVTLCFLKYLLKKKKQCQYDMFVSFSGPCSNLITVHDSSVSSYSSLDYSGSWWQVNWCSNVWVHQLRRQPTAYRVFLGDNLVALPCAWFTCLSWTSSAVGSCIENCQPCPSENRGTCYSKNLNSLSASLAVANQHQGILWSKQMGVNFGNFTFDVIWCWISSNSSPVS